MDVKQLTKIKNDWVLEVSDNILEKMNINPEIDDVEIYVKDNAICIKKKLVKKGLNF